MQLDLSQLGRHGRADEHVDRTFPPSAFGPPAADAEDYRIVAPVHLSMDVHKDRDAVRVKGQLQTTLRFECGRCLEPFDVPVNSEFELRYIPHAHNTGEGEREVDEDDLLTAFYRDDMLDLGELVREQFQLVLPMKPLCRDDCKGLCSECGTNLNRETCTCSHKWEDQRLAALRGLLDRSKEK